MKRIIMWCFGFSLALFCMAPEPAAAETPDRNENPDASPVSDEEKLDRGLRVEARMGGWEPDYTRNAYEGVLSYRGLDSLHLFAGYGYADQLYYAWHKAYAKGYYFYRPDSYAKLAASLRQYSYPADPEVQRPNPDSSSYDRVPSLEGEVSHWFGKTLRGTIGIECFRPDFFYDTTARASNYKISTELYSRTPFDFLTVKVLYALLRDPDPDKTEIKGRNNVHTPAGTASQTSIVYRTTWLLGGGLEVVAGRWEGEALYLPNRDLDNSYDHSILTNVRYRFTGRLTGRVDYVYDKYSDVSNYAGKTASVYMVSCTYETTARLAVGAGVKYIDLPTRDDRAGFVTVRFKTGAMF